MLASLLTTLYNSTDITQSAQSLSADAIWYSSPAIQAKQSVQANAFLRINATASVIQQSQSLSASAIYYDIAANGTLVQSTQSVSANSFVQINAQVNAVQAIQYVYISSTNGVFTSQSASRVYDRAWILRRVRNKGAR